MKNLYKFFLALWVYTSVFAQITEITRLPVQEISQSIKESAPVWLSENEIMIFYNFNPVGLASGVYIYQLRVNDYITSKKMVLIR